MGYIAGISSYAYSDWKWRETYDVSLKNMKTHHVSVAVWLIVMLYGIRALGSSSVVFPFQLNIFQK